MQSMNPIYVLKNSVAQTVIEDAENDDFSSLKEVLNILLNPF